YYWFESGTMSSLVEHLKHFPEFNPLDYDGVHVSLEEFNVPCENADTPMPLLYQSGYLSIDTYDKDVDEYILHFPNREVRHGMVYGMTNYLIDNNSLDRNASISKMARALLHGDLNTALTVLRAYIASIPYDIITKKEWMAKQSREGFYKMLMYIIFSLLNSKIDTEVKSILGRADVVIQTKNDVFVLELKVDKSVDEALAQIESKDYAIQYTADGRKITKCGVMISTEARNIVHWRSVSEDGVVIDEQDFRQQGQ
ncbi:MAG: PD-(D/E)XK nuclease domain-containing protein, partial [Muribaculaceae bacterium]